MTQDDLGKFVGAHKTSISKYENRDDFWKNGQRSKTLFKLIKFIDGVYDDELISSGFGDTSEKTSSTNKEKPVEKKLVDITIKSRTVEETLNDAIGILQERLTCPDCSDDDAKIYVSMIAGLCDGYLQHK